MRKVPCARYLPQGTLRMVPCARYLAHGVHGFTGSRVHVFTGGRPQITFQGGRFSQNQYKPASPSGRLTTSTTTTTTSTTTTTTMTTTTTTATTTTITAAKTMATTPTMTATRQQHRPCQKMDHHLKHSEATLTQEFRVLHCFSSGLMRQAWFLDRLWAIFWTAFI